MVQGCKNAGIIGCTGDGVPPIITQAAFAAITAAKGHGISFIKPWESDELDEKLDRSFASGCKIVGMSVAAGRTTLDKDALREELTEIFHSKHQGDIDVDTLLARCERTGSPFEKLSISPIN